MTVGRKLNVNKKVVSKVGNRINNFSRKLKDSIDSEISNLQKQILNTASQINVVHKSIENLEKYYRCFCSLRGGRRCRKYKISNTTTLYKCTDIL